MALPPEWAPPSASPRAAAAWKENPLKRGWKLLHADEQTIREYVTIGIESFSAQEMDWAIHHGYDVLPGLIIKGQLNHPLRRPFARKQIYHNWTQIHRALTHPKVLIEDIRRRDPAKAAVIDTPTGRDWLDWTCYRVHSFMRVYAKIRGTGVLAPPSSPNPIHHALELAGP